MKGADTLTGDVIYCEPSVGDVLRLLKDFARTLDRAGLAISGGDLVLHGLKNRLEPHVGYRPSTVDVRDERGWRKSGDNLNLDPRLIDIVRFLVLDYLTL